MEESQKKEKIDNKIKFNDEKYPLPTHDELEIILETSKESQMSLNYLQNLPANIYDEFKHQVIRTPSNTKSNVFHKLFNSVNHPIKQKTN